MSTISRFPFRVVLKIAKILYIQECFVELEYVMYIFPILSETLSCKVPTVILVDDNQYDKFSQYLHSRERPFGSRDLFIIKQKSSIKSNSMLRYQSKCYMVLGSQCYLKSIPQEFKRLGNHVKLVEQDCTHFNSSSKFYELIWKPDDYDFAFDLVLPKLYGRHYFLYSYHVGILLNVFLKPISPRLIRLEAYSGKSDLFFEWRELYGVYSSFISASYPSDSYRLTTIPGTDSEMNMPNCSFEFIKDIDQLSSLYQYSTVLNPHLFEWSSKFSAIRWLKRRLRYTGNKTKTAFFYNLDSIRTDRILPTQGNSSNKFISIDCSRSATPDRSAYQFVQNYFFYVPKTLRCRTQENSQIDGTLLVRPGINSKTRPYPPYYIDVFHRDFPLEKLQSADITAFNSNFKAEFTEKKQSLPVEDTRFNTKHLDCYVNKTLKSIKELRKDEAQVPKHKIELCKLLSEQIMTYIVQEVTKNVENEGLDRQQPLRLRVFSNHSQRINCASKYEAVKNWFHS